MEVQAHLPIRTRSDNIGQPALSEKRDPIPSSNTPPPNYFTCTLGQAATIGTFESEIIQTITDFIDHQAQHYPDAYAVGFLVPQPQDEPWKYQLLSELDMDKSMR